MAYLGCTPLHAHHEACATSCTQNATNVVDLAENIAAGVGGRETGRVVIAEHAEQKTDEVPHTNKDTVKAPVARFRDKLCKKHRGAEGQNGCDDEADVLAAVLDGHNLGRSSKGDEFVQTSTET